ncbi:MAG TPA: DPP IV N-terminal domain-containing protein, partial [Chthoniobacterales bacterium]
MNAFRRSIFILGLLAWVVSSAFAQAPRGITPEDYFAFEFISDPNISPDGKLVAYVVTKIDRAQNRRNSSIWMVATDGSRAPWQFTTAPQSANSPRWSPDGKSLAFLSSRPEAAAPGAGSTAVADQPRPQVYLLSMNGGEARRITNLKNGVSLFRWSPDGTRLVIVSRVGPSDARTGDPRDRSDVRHYKHTSYKFNDTGWFDDRRTHFWIVDVKSGEAKQITRGDDWNDSDPQWSPDGRRIAFVSNRTGHEYDENRNTDVWVINADGSGTLTKISDHEEADNQPRWSPDGKTIAFAGEVHERDHPQIWLAPASGGAASTLAANGLDLIPGQLEWSDDAKSIYFETGVKGELHLFRVDLPSKSVIKVTSGPRAVRSVDFDFRNGKMVYLANDFKHLDDLYISDLDGRHERKLTNLNEALWKELKLADVERFTYKGADEWDVDAFVVKPIDWRPGKKYPLVLSIHGGPAGQYGVDW